MFKLALRCVLIACMALLAGCPKSASKGSALDEAQYAWSAAIRWGDFEGAWNLVDPEVRKAHPITELELSRYKQVQISVYRDTGSGVCVAPVRASVNKSAENTCQNDTGRV